jgi:hypothetical protein
VDGDELLVAHVLLERRRVGQVPVMVGIRAVSNAGWSLAQFVQIVVITAIFGQGVVWTAE